MNTYKPYILESDDSWIFHSKSDETSTQEYENKKKIRTDYNDQRAQMIVNLKNRGMSFNNIVFKLVEEGYDRITPQRAHYIYHHYYKRVLQMKKKGKK